MATRADREAILARRALFLASALTGIANAQPECPPKREAAPEDLAHARALFERARELAAAGEHDTALAELERAYELTTNARVLATLAQVAALGGDSARALGYARRALACTDQLTDEARAEATRIEQEARGQVAELVVRSVPAGAELEIDGARVSGESHLVNPGRLRLFARWPDGAETSLVFEIAAGEQRELTLTAPPIDDCSHPPCVCLQPCLSPPIEIERRSRFGVGLGYTSLLGAEGHGARGLFYLEVPLGDVARARLGPTAVPTTTPDGALVPVGGELAVLFSLGSFELGPTTSVGWMFADDASPFVNPELSLGFAFGERVTAGVRGGPFFAADTWVSGGAFLTLSFGPACSDGYDPVRCDDDGPLQAHRQMRPTAFRARLPAP